MAVNCEIIQVENKTQYSFTSPKSLNEFCSIFNLDCGGAEGLIEQTKGNEEEEIWLG